MQRYRYMYVCKGVFTHMNRNIERQTGEGVTTVKILKTCVKCTLFTW